MINHFCSQLFKNFESFHQSFCCLCLFRFVVYVCLCLLFMFVVLSFIHLCCCLCLYFFHSCLFLFFSYLSLFQRNLQIFLLLSFSQQQHQFVAFHYCLHYLHYLSLPFLFSFSLFVQVLFR